MEDSDSRLLFPKFAFKNKMFEKVTCNFSFSNLEFYSELTYNKISF